MIACSMPLAGCAAVLAIVLSAPFAMAQDVWIGRPTIGDYVRRDIAAVIQSIQQAREAGKVKAEFNQEIGQARKAFFATAGTPDKRGPVEKKFADLLRQKDNHNLLMSLVSGEPSGAGGFTGAFDALSGGPLDGGIPAVALPAFNRWVDAMRKSLGNLSTADETRLAKAMLDNSGLYEQYKLERDKAEIEAFIKRKKEFEAHRSTNEAIGRARLADGSFRLHEQQQGGLDLVRGRDLRWDRLGHNQPLRARLIGLKQAGQQVLRCDYGPSGTWSDGRPRYEGYTFWYKQPPDGIDELLSMDTTGGLAGLGTRTAHAMCPDTSAVAKAASDTALADASARMCAGIKAHIEQVRQQTATTVLQKMEKQNLPAMERNHAATCALAKLASGTATRSGEPAAAAPAPMPPAKTMEQRRAEAEAQTAQRMADARTRMCARTAARIEQVRQQTAIAPPAQILGLQNNLQRLERFYAKDCGG